MDNTNNALPVGLLLKQADDGVAKPIGDFIIMSEDISNSYLVMTPDGNVVINTGTVAGGSKHRERYAALNSQQIRKVIITQSHHDHFGGLEAFSGDQPELIVHRRFCEGYDYRARLRPFYDQRAARIWKLILGDRQPGWPDFEIEPDVLVGDSYAFELGRRRFEVISTPGGETLDSVSVWLPYEKILFVGNLLGPAYMTMPNLNPIRGDKPRSAMEYVRSLDLVRALGAEVLITGHGEPVFEAAKIAADLSHMRNAISRIHDETLDGMATGRSLEELMRGVVLPLDLALNEWYGKTSWVVRTIWEEYTGWFQQDFTSRLYEVPVSRVFADVVRIAGPDALVARAKEHLAAGHRLEALHLAEIVLEAEQTHREALSVQCSVLQLLRAAADEIKNINETMWLRTEIAAVEAKLASV